ncbi:hypothetical protein WKH03_09730 [Pantoea agglomerans]|uniref:hypothetical protein n=1 Tax=Enterobacter agglomerans TaxID=549 RepID=UPI003C7DF5B9
MNILSLVPVSAANDAEPMFEAYGCHGTCMSRALSISQHGFTLSQSGRRGPGAYFWYAETDRCRYAYKLAKAWFNVAVKRSEYREETDQSGAVVWGAINAPESEVLNLESPAFRHTLRQALSANWATISKNEDKEALVSSVHEMIIKRTEAKHPVSVVLATVQQPKRTSDELAVVIGEPFAIIIRKLSCLTLDSNIEGIPA